MEAGRQTWKPSSRQALADYTGMVMYGVWDSPNLYLRTPSELDSQWFLTPGAFGPGTNDANGDEDAPKAFLADVFLAGHLSRRLEVSPICIGTPRSSQPR